MTKKEDYAFVLDFLSNGKPGEARKQPIAQVVGESYFTLLELVLLPGKEVSPQDRVFIGKGERESVDQIRGRINYIQLTNVAQAELPKIVSQIVKEREAEFVAFVNKAGPINIRAHALELLPGIGKKHLEEILKQRESKPFESFADVAARVTHLGDPVEIFVNRVLEELKDEQKYYLFTRGPAEEHEEGRHFEHRDDRYGSRPRY